MKRKITKLLAVAALMLTALPSDVQAQTNVTSVSTGKYYWLKGANSGTGSSYMYVHSSGELKSEYTNQSAVAANGDVWELEEATTTNVYYLKNIYSSKYIKLTANGNSKNATVLVSSDDKTPLFFEKHTVSDKDYWLVSPYNASEEFKYLNFHYPGMAVWSSTTSLSDNDTYIYELAKYSITVLGNNVTDVTISGNNHKSIVTDGCAYIDADITESESLTVTASDGSSASIVAFDSSGKTMTVNVSLPISEYTSAISSITDGSYRIYALDGTRKKRYLQASSGTKVGSDNYKVYLGTTTTTPSDATTFSITQSSDGDSKEQTTGWKILYDSKWAFTNPEGGSAGGTDFTAGTSLIGYDATHRTNAYDRQLIYYSETAGAYAIRATNASGTSWGASALWGLDGSGNACYVSDASYIWYFEPVITPAYDKTTYVTTMPLDFSNVDGLKAYRASTAGGGSVTLTEVDAVPASTPLLLIGTAGTAYTIPVAASASDPGTNLLKPGDGTTEFTAATYDYILFSDGLFYRVTSGTVATTKAYLHCDSDPTSVGARSLSLVFGDDDTTSISEEFLDERRVKSVYDLQGRRIANPNKGLYIVNGKKVLVGDNR